MDWFSYELRNSNDEECNARGWKGRVTLYTDMNDLVFSYLFYTSQLNTLKLVFHNCIHVSQLFVLIVVLVHVLGNG